VAKIKICERALENYHQTLRIWIGVWPKPGTKEDSLKKTFVMRVPGQSAYIAAGYYPK
jgi:hypothetical protein